jgi:hypothetical protein
MGLLKLVPQGGIDVKKNISGGKSLLEIGSVSKAKAMN